MNPFGVPVRDLALSNLAVSHSLVSQSATVQVGAIQDLTSTKVKTSTLKASSIQTGTLTSGNIVTTNLTVNGSAVIPGASGDVKSFGTASGVDTDEQTVHPPSQVRLGTNALLTVGTGVTSFANLAAGTNALSSLPDDGANSNIAVGYDAGTSLIDGSNNIFVGEGAGRSLQEANQNVAIGSRVLLTPVFGNVRNNVAIGSNVLTNCDVTHDSVCIGESCCFSATGLRGVVAIGSNACRATTGGFENDDTVAIGINALTSLTTSANNVAVGGGALRSLVDAVHGSNTAVGAYCLGNATGASNTALGSTAGTGVLAGSGNIFIGDGADSGGDVSDCIVIAKNVSASGSGQTIIGNNGTTQCVIRGISGVVATGGDAVFVTSDGILGTATSFLKEQEVKETREIKEIHLSSLTPLVLVRQDGQEQLGFIKSDTVNDRNVIPLLVKEVNELRRELELLKLISKSPSVFET